MLCTTSFSQKNLVVVKKGNHGKHHHHGNNKNVIVVHKSNFRPAVVHVYHPIWAPHKSMNRRWVYFPKHQCYWDNWRNVYYYKNKNYWISSVSKPIFIINVDLAKEKQFELKEVDDDDDTIFNSNEKHVIEYQ